MPVFTKLTPNLLVASVDRSLAFYVDILGFARGMTVPDQSPFAFASVASGPVEIFFNDAAGAVRSIPASPASRSAPAARCSSRWKASTRSMSA